MSSNDAPARNTDLIKEIEQKEVKLQQTKGPKPSHSDLMSSIRTSKTSVTLNPSHPKPTRSDLLTEIRTEGKKKLQHVDASPKNRDELLSDIRAWKRENSGKGSQLNAAAIRDRTALLSDIRKHMVKKEEVKQQ